MSQNVKRDVGGKQKLKQNLQKVFQIFALKKYPFRYLGKGSDDDWTVNK